MHLPRPRGDLSALLVEALGTGAPLAGAIPAPTDDEDRQVALWALYELHYRGFDEVGPEREWDPDLLRLRLDLEADFEQELRELTADLVAEVDAGGPVADALQQVTEYDGPSLSRYLQRRATPEQFREYLTLRSVYHLKETDAHAFLLPRLGGPAKVALAEICYDEYGAGRPEALHQQLFADALEAAGLSSEYGHYLDQAPAHVLRVNNAMSLFGLHRRLAGAAAGHLAAFEMTSSLPCRRIVIGAERLGFGPAVSRYFDEHVEADAVHEQVASRALCGSLVEERPDLYGDVLFGAAACVLLDAASAAATLADWDAGRSATRDELSVPAA